MLVTTSIFEAMTSLPGRQRSRHRRSTHFHPWCANLIVDLAFFAVTISSTSLLDALQDAGIRAEWVLPYALKQLQPGQVVLRAFRGLSGLELRQAEMSRLTLELVDLATWVESLKELLTQADLSGHPWPYFADEHKVWA
jgi:hypothetical protein